jgi:hypothetical protein
VTWDPSTIDSSAGSTPLAKVLVVFALPAFLVSLLVVGFAGSHGANQIILFFALTPTLRGLVLLSRPACGIGSGEASGSSHQFETIAFKAPNFTFSLKPSCLSLNLIYCQ